MRAFSLAALLVALVCQTASAQVTFKVQFPEGETVIEEIAVTAGQTMILAGMEIKTEADNAVVMKSESGRRNDDGELEQQITFQSARANLMLPGNMSLQYDSSINLAKVDNEQLQPFLDMLRLMSGAKVTVVLNKDNQVTDVRGIDAILQEATGTANSLLKLELSKEKFARQYKQAQAWLPDGPVKPGDRWTREIEVDLGSGQTLRVEREFEYEGTVQKEGHTLHKINSPDKKILSLDVQKSDLLQFDIPKSDLKVVDSKASFLFDNDRGQIVEDQRLLQVKGSITLSVQGNNLDGEVEFKIESMHRRKT